MKTSLSLPLDIELVLRECKGTPGPALRGNREVSCQLTGGRVRGKLGPAGSQASPGDPAIPSTSAPTAPLTKAPEVLPLSPHTQGQGGGHVLSFPVSLSLSSWDSSKVANVHPLRRNSQRAARRHLWLRPPELRSLGDWPGPALPWGPGPAPQPGKHRLDSCHEMMHPK